MDFGQESPGLICNVCLNCFGGESSALGGFLIKFDGSIMRETPFENCQNVRFPMSFDKLQKVCITST